MRCKPLRYRGFTLTELVWALLVVAVLAGLAYPSYLDTVRKARRAEAMDGLQQIQLAQERWRADHSSYGTLAQLAIAGTTSGGYYTLSLSGITATGYTAAATAVAGKSQTGDAAQGVSCATLSMNQDGPVYSPAGQTACWVR